MKNRDIFTAMLLVLACFALLPVAQAGNNTAYGDGTLSHVTTGENNSAFGWAALFSDNTGGSNTAIGAGALVLNTGGSGNTAVGTSALVTETGAFNTAVGASALISSTTGGPFGAQANTAVGNAALYHCTTGYWNVGIGYTAGYDLTQGHYNVFIGQAAGNNVTTASNVICIGQGVGGANTDHTCAIGEIFGRPSSGGSPVYVNASGILGTSTSSKRFKEGIKPMDKASEALYALKPVTFRYNKEMDPSGIRQFGLVAEDVDEVNPDLVVRDKDGKVNSVRYDQVNAMLLNEFLKEHRKVQQLEGTISSLAATVKEQAAQIQKVSAQIEVSKSATKVVLNNP
jgi:hypothetical protein